MRIYKSDQTLFHYICRFYDQSDGTGISNERSIFSEIFSLTSFQNSFFVYQKLPWNMLKYVQDIDAAFLTIGNH